MTFRRPYFPYATFPLDQCSHSTTTTTSTTSTTSTSTSSSTSSTTTSTGTAYVSCNHSESTVTDNSLPRGSLRARVSDQYSRAVAVTSGLVQTNPVTGHGAGIVCHVLRCPSDIKLSIFAWGGGFTAVISKPTPHPSHHSCKTHGRAVVCGRTTYSL